MPEKDLTIQIPDTEQNGSCNISCPLYVDGEISNFCALDFGKRNGKKYGYLYPGKRCPQHEKYSLIRR